MSLHRRRMMTIFHLPSTLTYRPNATSAHNNLRDEMGSHDADKLACRYHLGALPEPREMPLVAGDQIVSASRLCAFQEFIIIGVYRHLQLAGNLYWIQAVPEQLKKLALEPFADLQLPTRQHHTIFRPNGVRHVQSGRVSNRERKSSARQAIGFQGRRDRDIRVEHSRTRIIPASVVATVRPLLSHQSDAR
jgi:hypothetical protein